MHKIKWLDLIIALSCIYITVTMLSFNNAETYYGYAQEPYGEDPKGSTILHYILYKIDGWGGRVGVVCFFSLISSYFLYSFYRDNVTSILNLYRNWRKKRDKRKI